MINKHIQVSEALTLKPMLLNAAFERPSYSEIAIFLLKLCERQFPFVNIGGKTVPKCHIANWKTQDIRLVGGRHRSVFKVLGDAA